MRTCAAMGIATVAVFSDADASALHVRAADEAVRIGPAPVMDSYLNISTLIAAAQRSDADAIHPGYGFLAENAGFAAACQDAGLTFIGPEPGVIARMGSKREAKLLMAAAGVPVVPGYEGEDQSDERFIAAAHDIGYPVMVKASAGGGGKGMRVVAGEQELPEALAAARHEAKAAFGDDTLILEKVITEARHVEFQIFGDSHGNIIHLGERECSIQRRHQKIIEETPSTALTPELRERMGAAAIIVGRQLNYTNAGTVEFILDAAHNFYFLEVNTRLQVEHPITELVTGLDLVRWQLLVAQGYPLPLKQEEITFGGHAVEARLYAEDPAHNFLPATGPVALWHAPDGENVRVDAGIQTGDVVSPFYDPLLAKISAWGEDRAEALRRLDRALATTVLLGVRNNSAFLRRILLHPAHLAGDISTAFIERHAETLQDERVSNSQRAIAALAVAIQRHRCSQAYGRSTATYRWRNNPQRPIIERFEPALELRLRPLSVNHYEALVVDTADASDVNAGGAQSLAIIVHTPPDDEPADRAAMTNLALEVDGHLVRVSLAEVAPGEWWAHLNGTTQVMHWRSPLPEPSASSPLASRTASASTASDNHRQAKGAITAPMPGVIVAMLVAPGQTVAAGEPLLILSAMKMEQTLRAPHDGIVSQVYYQAGEQVTASAVLLELADG
jgi:acetyl-CoA carboxylase biotin carboxylase subunit